MCSKVPTLQRFKHVPRRTILHAAHASSHTTKFARRRPAIRQLQRTSYGDPLLNNNRRRVRPLGSLDTDMVPRCLHDEAEEEPAECSGKIEAAVFRFLAKELCRRVSRGENHPRCDGLVAERHGEKGRRKIISYASKMRWRIIAQACRGAVAYNGYGNQMASGEVNPLA